jgi:predicted nucleic acid-binding protein
VAAFDFDAAVRWGRFAPQSTLARRDDQDLPFIREERLGGQALLLDTCVYIDQLQNRTPDIIDRVIASGQINHSTVVIQELMHTVGVLDPKDRRTPAAVAQIRGLVRSMPSHRVFTADADVLGRSGLLSGFLCRLQGYSADRKHRALQDCILFLQAQRLGLAVLTANIADFDVLLQLLPMGRVLFYRRR